MFGSLPVKYDPLPSALPPSPLLRRRPLLSEREPLAAAFGTLPKTDLSRWTGFTLEMLALPPDKTLGLLRGLPDFPPQ